MNKKQFIKEFSLVINLPQNETEKIINQFFELVKDMLKKGLKVRFFDFGTFKLVQKNERFYYNPNTRGRVLAPNKKVVTFKMSKRLL